MSDTRRAFARLALADGRRVFAALSGHKAHIYDAAPWFGGKETGEVLGDIDAQGRSASAQRLAPATHSKIICVGRNYEAHASELGNTPPPEPLLFLKPPSAILDPDGAVELPEAAISERVDHEAELAVVIGKRARRLSATEAMEAVFGYTLAFDITARDLQKKDGQWTRAKGMDTFCPVGPIVVTGLDPHALSIECHVSGSLRQRGSTRDMIFSVPAIIAYVSRVITLEPGDLLLTGTPPGVGPLHAGDALSMSIAEIGTLSVSIVGPP